jgi:hypothetical protein
MDFRSPSSLVAPVEAQFARQEFATLILHFIGAPSGVDAPDEWAIKSQENLPDIGQINGPFESIRCPSPSTDSVVPGGRVKIKQQQQIRNRCKSFIGRDNGLGIDPPGPLVRCSREVVTVQNHDLSALERRPDQVCDVFMPILQEQIEFRLDREPAAASGFTKGAAVRAIGGLAARRDGTALAAAPVSQSALERGLAGAVDSFDHE